MSGQTRASRSGACASPTLAYGSRNRALIPLSGRRSAGRVDSTWRGKAWQRLAGADRLLPAGRGMQLPAGRDMAVKGAKHGHNSPRQSNRRSV
jgi:hypothetical protein